MARKSFSVLFFIKKCKLLKNGEAPVCMRIHFPRSSHASSWLICNQGTFSWQNT